MEPATLIGIGTLIASACAVLINLWIAKRNKRKADISNAAEVIRAENEMRINSIEGAQRIIEMYGSVIADQREHIQRLESRIKELRKG